MTRRKCKLVLLALYSCLFQVSWAFLDPTTLVAAGVATGLSALYAGWGTVKCMKYECCTDQYIKFDEAGLERDLKNRLHGQHLVQNTVLRALKGHLRAQNPTKALLMSFHGWTGGGKNFVSKIIAENMFKKGLDSDFVHLFIATKHFPHESMIEIYKTQLQEKIQKAVENCGRSLFIFDETDKMPQTLLDIITPYVDYHQKIDGLDYRNSVFIFLSNTGGTEITKVAYQWYQNGKEREEILLKDIEGIVTKSVFNELGGLHRTKIIEKNLIDVFVPFLPLEKKHVKECVMDDLNAKGRSFISKTLVENVVNELEYFPPDVNLFSVSGCKRVSKKVDVFLD